MKNIEAGDTVQVEARVSFVKENGWVSAVFRSGAHSPDADLSTIWFKTDCPAIVKHVKAPPPPPKVGERVIWKLPQPGAWRRGMLLAIHGNRGWVKLDTQEIPISPWLNDLVKEPDNGD